MVAHAPPSLQPFFDMGAALLLKAELPARDRELAILRVAHLTGSAYEWHQHEIIGRAVGLTDADLDLARHGASADELDSLLIAATDEITTTVRLTDETLAELLRVLGDAADDGAHHHRGALQRGQPHPRVGARADRGGVGAGSRGVRARDAG